MLAKVIVLIALVGLVAALPTLHSEEEYQNLFRMFIKQHDKVA